MKTPNYPENLEHLTRCPLCEKNYHFTRALILDEEDDRTTFHLTCDSCQTATLVFVSTGQFGVVSLGMVTDLGRDEAKNFFQEEAVSADDVLDTYNFLKDFDGDIKELI